MGEDFLRRKNESFIRHRDTVFERTVEPDLFSDAAATECIRLVGSIREGAPLEVGQELWARHKNGEPLEFIYGATAAVVCNGPDRSALENTPHSLIARVEDVDRDDQLVVLRVQILSKEAK